MLDKTRQFRELMMRYLSGNISDSDERFFLDILHSDPKYKIIYTEMAKTMAISQYHILESKKTANYKYLLRLISNGLLLNRQPNPLQYFLRIAAIVLFVLSTSISTYYIYTGYNSKENILSYQTVVPFGSQTKIILPDGTIACLNSGSTLKYNNSYGNKNRTVYLTGEGYFDVHKNPKKPFLVYANDIQIKVLGTVFNVQSYINDQTVEVNLLKGKVDITLNSSGKSGNLTLKPNEKMIYNKKTNTIYSYKTDASKSVQWTIGKLCFSDASFFEIAKQLERRYDVKILIESDKVKNERFSGTLDTKEPLEKVLNHIDVDKKFLKTYNGKTVLITNN